MDQVMHWFLNLPAWGQIIMVIVGLIFGFNIIGFVIGVLIYAVTVIGMILAAAIAFIIAVVKSIIKFFKFK